jgi:hypothetical protein
MPPAGFQPEWHAELAPHSGEACRRAYRLGVGSAQAWLSATPDGQVDVECIVDAESSTPQIRRFELSAAQRPGALPSESPVQLSTLLAQACGVELQPLEGLVPLFAAQASSLVSFQRWLGQCDAINVKLTQELPRSSS